MNPKPPTRRAAPSPRSASPAAKKAAARDAVRGETASAELQSAIKSDLAPAVAIAMLAKTDAAPDAPAPALEALAAGASPSTDDGKVRLQVMFENGSVLPIEMSKAAGDALSQGLADALAGEGSPRA
jgi:hypothetical protein